MRIITIGPFPPPFGGVSTHLIRLKKYLEISGDSYVFLDTTIVHRTAKLKNKHGTGLWKKGSFFSVFFGKRSIIHFHNFSAKYFLINYFLLALRHCVILSFHNERFIEELHSKGKLWYPLFCYLINRMSTIVVDNTKCSNLIRQVVVDTNKIVLIPEFIPPANVPDIARDYIINIRKNHKYLFSSNAWKISFYKSQDLYGIDLLIEAANSLYNSFGMDIAIAFLLPSIGEEIYFQEVKQKIIDFGLHDRFIFITEPLEEASSLWKISDLVIRATNTDGNSLSILEALYLGIPVMASDCVERPEGVILFKSRDAQDLTIKIQDFIVNIEKHKKKTQLLSIENNAHKMLTLYHSIQNRYN